jgi:hypothetical protein
MSNSLEQELKGKYAELLGLTFQNSAEKSHREAALFEVINPIVSQASDLSASVDEFKDRIFSNNRILETGIKETSRYIKQLIAKSSRDNKYSKIFIPDLVDTVTDGAIVKNGTIYGHTKNENSFNSIELDSDSISLLFYTNENRIKSRVVKNKTLDPFMSENFSINPISNIGAESNLIISIPLSRVESIRSILYDMDKSRSSKIFYKEPGRSEFMFLTEQEGSKVEVELNKDVTDIKIIINVKSTDRSGGIRFNKFAINRYNLSQDTQLDITQNITSNGDFLEIVRCDSNNSNIEYLISVDGRPFKNATEGPVRTYGVEDGEVYTLSAIRATTKDGKELRVFNPGIENTTLMSNEWRVFSMKSDYSSEDFGSMEFWKCIAVYRDKFQIVVPSGKHIFINGKKSMGTVIIYPGIHTILIPKNTFTKLYSRKFYDMITYSGQSITLTRQDGTNDVITSVNDVFAQIDCTATYVFGEELRISNISTDGTLSPGGLFEIETSENTVFLGFEPIKPSVRQVTVKVLFKKSTKVAEVNHIAVKIF